MSSVDELFSYIFVWHALSDACPKCRSLNGQEFHDQNLFQNTLFSPVWGNIWNLDTDRSLMHGGVGTCRCQLEVRVDVDLSKWRELQELYEVVELMRVRIEH